MYIYYKLCIYNEKGKLSTLLFLYFRERIKKDMDLYVYQHSVKKKQAEEIINQLIAEVDLADSETKKLKNTYKSVKAGNNCK